jgi:plastocyanin
MAGSVIVSSGAKPAVSYVTATTMPPVINPVASSPKAGKTETVFLKDGAFNPMDLSITRGTTVIWINDGPGTYRIVSGRYPSGVEFYSDPLRIGDVFSYTFTLPGVYSYYEAQRSAMTGTVTVR